MTVKTGTIIETYGDYCNIRLDNESVLNDIKNNGHSNGAEVIIDYDETNAPHILNSPINSVPSQEVIDSIISTVEARLLERDHPVGSPYFTFLVDDDPNERFPSTTWVLLDEDTYLVSAGSNLVGMTPIGSNTHTLTTAQMPIHTHIANEHTHRAYYNQSGYSQTIPASVHYLRADLSAGPVVGWSTAALTGQNTAGVNIGATATNQNMGSGEAHNNMPKSLAIYMWRRVN